MVNSKKARDLIEQHFTKKQYREAAQLLSNRWKKNRLDINIIKGKVVLNMGAGSGRYSYALRILGAKKVIGIDSLTGKRFIGNGIEYRKGDMLNMPFLDKQFDFVFCNGVLSHTKRWKKGIKEAYRVLKPGGWLWISLYGKGKVWQYADRVSKKMNFNDAKSFQYFLLNMDWPPNKIFFLSNIFFSKDRVYFTRRQVEFELREIGFGNIRYLRRGVKTDLNEKIFKNPKLREVFGEGELRFLAQKEG